MSWGTCDGKGQIPRRKMGKAEDIRAGPWKTFLVLRDTAVLVRAHPDVEIAPAKSAQQSAQEGARPARAPPLAVVISVVYVGESTHDCVAGRVAGLVCLTFLSACGFGGSGRLGRTFERVWASGHSGR